MRSLFLAPLLFLGSLAPLDAAGVVNDDRFRIVNREGDQLVGSLQFIWTTFRVVDVEPPGDDDDSRGGRGAGGRGGRGGGGGLWGAIGLLKTLAEGDPTTDLGWIDRIEGAEGGVFHAHPLEVVSPFLDDAGFQATYGGLALPFRSADGWSCVRAEGRSLVLVRRDETGEIVGVFRLGVHRFGDGESLDVELDTDEVDVDAVVREIDRDRFEIVMKKDAQPLVLADGSSVHLVTRDGREELTEEPLSVEVALWTEGPFLPRVDVLVRGAERETVREEARRLLAAVRFTRDEPAATRRAIMRAGRDPQGQGQDPEGGGGRGGGRGGRGGGGGGGGPPLGAAVTDADSEFLVDGKYVNPRLGVEFRSRLPKGWSYLRADELGMLAGTAPEDGRLTEMAAVGLAVLDGTVAAEDSADWLAERFIVPGTEGKRPKARRTRIGSHGGHRFEVEEDAFRSRIVRQRFFVEDRGRTVIITLYGAGSGNQGEKLLKPLTKWLKGLKLSTPSG